MILHIPLIIAQQISYYAKAASPNEVTGIGTIKQFSPDSFIVTEIFLPRQKTNPGYSEFDDGELNNIIIDLATEKPDEVVDLRFRWHSHADSQVFWSTTDNADIAKWQAPWVVNLVTNTAGDLLARFDMFEPFRIVEYPLEVVIGYNDELMTKCLQEVAEKVKFLPLNPLQPIDSRKLQQEVSYV